jgi:hypothetical protein
VEPQARDRGTREERLSGAFVDLAETLVGTFDVDGFLHLLCERIEDVLDVDAVGVMLESPEGTLRLWSASTADVAAIELFEMQERQGPCFDAYKRGDQVGVADLARAEDRWPEFTPRAMSAGFAAVFAFPMRVRDVRVGSVNAFRRERGDLDERDRKAGQALADMATLALLSHRQTADAETLATQLQHALDARVLIEQAKGALAERTGTTPRDAWERMRRHARHEQRPIRTLCADIISGALTP